MSNDKNTSRCAICGDDLPEHSNSRMCPKCLLGAGLHTQEGPEGTAVLPTDSSSKGLPQPGEQFGHYHLVRLLGQGGMGVVYEAEDLESGRRVALKILGQALDSPESRKRFIREGQLAASINHPNSVYVFGTEEIAGTPVIAMELVAGGTLRDRIIASGPMGASEAVECVLQIIAGLEAAQKIGILHRDVKPSNCFIDSDGTVKIGDFGLSITTAVRTESNITASGMLFGTPAFSSPEQLRGEELSVRSDIYAVGVTLFHLLTGRMPFEAPNMVQLLATVLERKPESPAKFRADIPKGLCRAVLRCLEKDAGQRFLDYATLREALVPYAPGSPTPATLGLRLLAYLIDSAVLSVPSLLLSFGVFGGIMGAAAPGQIGKKMLMLSSSFLLLFFYYGLFEGLRGATLGKYLCRLRVVRSDRSAPGIAKAMGRVLIVFVLPVLPQWLLMIFSPDWMYQHMGDWKFSLVSFATMAIQLLIFSTVRRKNGFAAAHDLLTQTRVIVRSKLSSRPTLALQPEVLPNLEATPQMGPYFVLDKLGSSGANSELLLGYDARLLRKVWIRTQPAGAPAISSELRNLSRPGRLRWINGVRSSTESWDAYEASAGQALLTMISKKQDWDSVRFWLLDLAEELSSCQHLRQPLPPLSLDRIWITAEGRAKLLDFPPPDAQSFHAAKGPPPTPQEFLRQVAQSALEGRAVAMEEARQESPSIPLSMHARGFIDNLTNAANPAEVVTRLRPLLDKISTVTRARRVAMLAFMMCFPVFTVGILLIVSTLGPQLMKGSRDIVELQQCLIKLSTLGPETNQPDRKNLEIYIAGRFRKEITNSAVWNDSMARILIPLPQRAVAERIIATEPQPSPEVFAEAKAAAEKKVGISMEKTQMPAKTSFLGKNKGLLWVMGYGSTLIYAVIPSLLAGLLFRGGLVLRGLGVAVVNRKGVESRWRAFWRALMAWLPFVLLPIPVHALTPALGQVGAGLIAVGLLALLTVLSLVMQRSLADRLAGTYLVPRAPAPEIAGPFQGKGLLRVIVLLLILLMVFVATQYYKTKPTAATSPGSPGVEHVVLQPDGSPADGAQIWILENRNDRLNSFAPEKYYSQESKKVTAQPDGKYILPVAAEDRSVVFTHQNGLVTAKYAQVKSSREIKLQPWGRVEGVLMSEGKPKSGADVSLSLFDSSAGFQMSYSAVSKADGSFVFTNVPAGEYQLGREFRPRVHLNHGYASPRSYQMPLMVRPGEAIKVQYGGGGRTVIGQAISDNPDLTVDWLCDNHELTLKQKGSGLGTFLRKSWGLSSSPEAQLKEARDSRRYKLEFEPDGSFRAEDVPPGTYELSIRVTKHREEDAYWMPAAEQLGSLEREVVVPPGSEAVDLGVVTVAFKGGARVQKTTPPIDMTMQTVDNRTVRLSELRGKPVLLVFWASWSEKSMESLTELQKLYEEVGQDKRMKFVGVALDDDAETLKSVAASRGYDWTLARLDATELTHAAAAFDLNTIPGIFLITPDGRISGRNLEGVRLQAAIRRTLGTNKTTEQSR